MRTFTEAASRTEVSWFSIYLAESLAESFGDSKGADLFPWLVLHMARQASNGHIRSDLHRLEEEMADWYDVKEDAPADFDEGLPQRLVDGLSDLLEAASAKGILSTLADEEAPADGLPVPRPPLVLSADRRFIYFLKRRRSEDRFLSHIAARASAGRHSVFPSPESLPAGPEGALMKLLSEGRKFLILSGGPGTGKTTTVAALLSLIESGRSEIGEPPARIALAAPTGRAAARMGEAIGGSVSGRTLHSLLGLSPHRLPKHNGEDPLPVDLVIVDEASMVDLPTMNLLLDALAPETALLLVGDPDQLPSVEAGALLGDLLAGAAEAARRPAAEHAAGPLSGAVVNLTKVYRSASAILDSAAAVRSGDLKALESSWRDDGVRLHEPAAPERIAVLIAESFSEAVSRARRDGSADPELFRMYADHGVLSPLRRGPWGVESMNERISLLAGGTSSPFPGMPVVVTGNDRGRKLWNGDRGILLEKDGRIRAFFPGDAAGAREFPLAALPGWEPAWVQTIHRSQGSEFDRVTILLPSGAEGMLSREILYTALTRAKKEADLYADSKAIAASLSRKVSRNSRIRRWAAGSSTSAG